jgi:hypothetical protein
MVSSYGYNLLGLGSSLQELAHRGLPVAHLGKALAEVASGDQALASVLRPAPDILAAFAERIAALGSTPALPARVPIDYLELLDEAMPRARGRARQAG